MSRWRRSVDELTAGRRRQQAECERAQNALSRVTSCFQQLAASLGSSADSSFLREEMDETRALAHRICSGLSRRLLRLLSACDSAPVAVDDRHASERLWVLFLSAVEYFLSDLQRAKELIGQFPLTQRSSRRSLVNTGCTDGPVGLAARVALVQIPWLVLEEEPSPDLTNHIAGLEAQLRPGGVLVGGVDTAGVGRGSERRRGSGGKPGGLDGGGGGVQRRWQHQAARLLPGNLLLGRIGPDRFCRFRELKQKSSIEILTQNVAD
ncbi:regulator of G-protein signaling 9-binding protein isoform X1 [Xiphophorus couchianus]|uniref:regulator of G-protein signaling 9-binding protein isoform X1 n=1 Tax=Xiphophorus couchianus TaxID=32473 RepID=UPI0010162E48|nr:regulator of G-protein signaling 9-binding protein-like isoform X1 [Xiphophorus couchianus]